MSAILNSLLSQQKVGATGSFAAGQQGLFGQGESVGQAGGFAGLLGLLMGDASAGQAVPADGNQSVWNAGQWLSLHGADALPAEIAAPNALPAETVSPVMPDALQGMLSQEQWQTLPQEVQSQLQAAFAQKDAAVPAAAPTDLTDNRAATLSDVTSHHWLQTQQWLQTMADAVQPQVVATGVVPAEAASGVDDGAIQSFIQQIQQRKQQLGQKLFAADSAPQSASQPMGTANVKQAAELSAAESMPTEMMVETASVLPQWIAVQQPTAVMVAETAKYASGSATAPSGQQGQQAPTLDVPAVTSAQHDASTSQQQQGQGGDSLLQSFAQDGADAFQGAQTAATTDNTAGFTDHLQHIAKQHNLPLATEPTQAIQLPPAAHTLEAMARTMPEAAQSHSRPLYSYAAPSDQVLMHIRHAAATGQDSIRLQLHPEELGGVDIRISMRDDTIRSISIHADSVDTMDMLQRDSKELQRMLQDAGLKFENQQAEFSFSSGSQSGGEFGHHGSQHQASAQQDDFAHMMQQSSANSGMDLDAPVLSVAEALYAFSTQGNVDIRV